jgi:hypothetical protein
LCRHLEFLCGSIIYLGLWPNTSPQYLPIKAYAYLLLSKLSLLASIPLLIFSIFNRNPRNKILYLILSILYPYAHPSNLPYAKLIPSSSLTLLSYGYDYSSILNLVFSYLAKPEFFSWFFSCLLRIRAIKRSSRFCSLSQENPSIARFPLELYFFQIILFKYANKTIRL